VSAPAASERSVAREPVVVVTRDEPVDGPLSVELRARGLEVLSWPVLRTAPPVDERALREALARVDEFACLIFTSRHAASAVAERLTRVPSDVRVAAVGPRTQAALEAHGWRVDLVPTESSAAALGRVLAAQLPRGARVLFAAGDRALPTLASVLAEHGIEVQQVEAYRTLAGSLDVERCRAQIERERIGAVTFTSPSAVFELDEALGSAHFDRLLSHAASVALGPTTGRALATRGYAATLAEPTTLAGLAATTFRLLETRN
jgi:uroporphyrinogen III methyltransferase / synthase